jgi:hypothetical protein
MEQYSFGTTHLGFRYTFVFRLDKNDDGSYIVTDGYRMMLDPVPIHSGRPAPRVVYDP